MQVVAANVILTDGARSK